MPFQNALGDCNECLCGLVFYIHNEPVPVPLKRVDLKAKVVDFMGEVTVQQSYVNRETNPIEVSYIFPVEEYCAVVHFEAEVDGRNIEAVVKEKKKAQEEYNKAIENRQTAILLEETQPDMFQIKLGQLKAGSGAKITLKYITELPVEGKAVRLTVPTTIAPRYIPPTDQTEAAAKIAQIGYNSATDPATPLHIFVDVTMQGRIKSIKSPSHAMTFSVGKDPNAHGQFTGNGILKDGQTSVMDKDLIVLVESEDFDKPVVFFEKTKDTVAAMVSLVPSFNLKSEHLPELVFLVDRSGSMMGSSMEQARQALVLFLHSLPMNCHFNIYSFGSTYENLFPNGSQLYDDDSLAKAKNYVAGMCADLGGTEIYRPLEAIFKAPYPKEGLLRQIFVLTDGSVSNAEETIRLVKAKSGIGRVFSLGLGNSASRHLVKGIARAGNGTATFSNVDEDLRPKVMTMLKNSLQPALADVKINWGKEQEDEAASIVRQSPELETKRTLMGFMKPKEDKEEPKPVSSLRVKESYGAIFDGTRLLAFKIFDSSTFKLEDKVTITALAPDGPLSLQVSCTDQSLLDDGQFVHQLAARRRIQVLEEQEEVWETRELVETAITNLGLKYGLATKYTSFVGVDKQTKKTDFEPAMQTRHIKHEVPQGFGFGCASTQRGGGGQLFGQPMMLMSAPPPPMGVLFGASKSMPRVSRDAFYAERDCVVAEECEEDGMDTCVDSMRIAEKRPQQPPQQQQQQQPQVSYRQQQHQAPKPVDTLTAIINQQQASGAFSWSPAIEDLLQMDQAEALKHAPANVKARTWITALVVQLLQKKLPKQRDLWCMVVEKAKKFVNSPDILDAAAKIVQV